MTQEPRRLLYVERIALAIWKGRYKTEPDLLSKPWYDVVDEALLVMEVLNTPTDYMKLYLDKDGFKATEALNKIVDVALQEYHDAYDLPDD